MNKLRLTFLVGCILILALLLTACALAQPRRVHNRQQPPTRSRYGAVTTWKIRLMPTAPS